MNILLCSAGRRGELIKDFRKSLSPNSRIIATDMSKYASAIYFADDFYLMPPIHDDTYISRLLEICRKEKIDAITTLIDPEIELLSRNRDLFTAIGVEVLAPYTETAEMCFDKWKLYQHLKKVGVSTVETFDNFCDAKRALDGGMLTLPVFVKPRAGSGSVGARRVETIEELQKACEEDPTLIIQELMDCEDMDADVYVDTISHRPVSIFSKRKIETKIGGASKTVSFKDPRLFEFLQNALIHFKFNGPIDVDLFCRDGQYYLSEINPRFGGAYLHAYGAGVDFVKLIENNINGITNMPIFGDYEENIVMMMYDSVVIKREDEMG